MHVICATLYRVGGQEHHHLGHETRFAAHVPQPAPAHHQRGAQLGCVQDRSAPEGQQVHAHHLLAQHPGQVRQVAHLLRPG